MTSDNTNNDSDNITQPQYDPNNILNNRQVLNSALEMIDLLDIDYLIYLRLIMKFEENYQTPYKNTIKPLNDNQDARDFRSMIGTEDDENNSSPYQHIFDQMTDRIIHNRSSIFDSHALSQIRNEEQRQTNE